MKSLIKWLNTPIKIELELSEDNIAVGSFMILIAILILLTTIK